MSRTPFNAAANVPGAGVVRLHERQRVGSAPGARLHDAGQTTARANGLAGPITGEGAIAIDIARLRRQLPFQLGGIVLIAVCRT